MVIFMVLFAVGASATTTTAFATTTTTRTAAFGLPNNSHCYSTSRLHSPPFTFPKFDIATKRAVLVSSTTTTLQGVALLSDPPSQNNEMEDNNAWTAVPGGYLPHISMNEDGSMSSSKRETMATGNTASAAVTATTSSFTTNTSGDRSDSETALLIPVVTTLQDYKRIVADESNRMTVVRFAAPWCRACQAVQPHYVHLARQYAQNEQNQQQPQQPASDPNNGTIQGSPPPRMLVQFVECPVRKDTAVLHQGLGVPSVPFGHIYHPAVGLVEEVKLNKKNFATFKRLLETYVQGYCLVSFTMDEQGQFMAVDAAVAASAPPMSDSKSPMSDSKSTAR
jgi:thiol-disulfide isomerase/thioredoxin